MTLMSLRFDPFSLKPLGTVCWMGGGGSLFLGKAQQFGGTWDMTLIALFKKPRELPTEGVF